MADNDPYEPTQSFLGSPNESSAAAAVSSETPQLIERYRSEKVLGNCVFGLVYLAHDEQLDRPVAVKVPHARLISRPETE